MSNSKSVREKEKRWGGKGKERGGSRKFLPTHWATHLYNEVFARDKGSYYIAVGRQEVFDLYRRSKESRFSNISPPVLLVSRLGSPFAASLKSGQAIFFYRSRKAAGFSPKTPP